MPGIAKPGVAGRTSFTDDGVHACAGKESIFDVDPASAFAAAPAKAICRPCPVRAPCLRYALDRGEPHGVWGGLTGPERRKLGPVNNADDLVRRLHGAEAIAVADRVIRKGLSRAAAAILLGENDLVRALMVLRRAPQLGPEVSAGRLTLVEAALLADPDGHPNSRHAA